MAVSTGSFSREKDEANLTFAFSTLRILAYCSNSSRFQFIAQLLGSLNRKNNEDKPQLRECLQARSYGASSFIHPLEVRFVG